MLPAPVSRERIQAIERECDLSSQYLHTLSNIEGASYFMVLDDSGSMDEYSPITRMTRYQELQVNVLAALKLVGEAYVQMLNAGPLGVMTSERMQAWFQRPHRLGGTPLCGALRHVQELAAQASKAVVIIYTDGQPSDSDPDLGDGIKTFFRILKYERAPHVSTIVIACTDDDDDLEYLNGWDRGLPRLDVLDDEKSERQEVMRKRPRDRYTSDDHRIRCIVGPLDEYLDRLDECGPRPRLPEVGSRPDALRAPPVSADATFLMSSAHVFPDACGVPGKTHPAGLPYFPPPPPPFPVYAVPTPPFPSRDLTSIPMDTSYQGAPPVMVPPPSAPEYGVDSSCSPAKARPDPRGDAPKAGCGCALL